MSKATRRKFLQQTLVTGTAGLAGIGVVSAAAATPSQNEFLDYVGQKFSVQGIGRYDTSAAKQWVVLEQVSDLPLAPGDCRSQFPHVRQQHFSVRFRAFGKSPLEQGSYRLQHPKLGGQDLFLVPHAADDGGYHLEALIN